MSQPASEPVTRRQAAFDVLFWLAIAVVWLAIGPLRLPIRYVMIGIGLAILGFAWVIRRRGTESWQDFGLSRTNLAAAGRATLLFTLLCAAGILAIGWYRGVPLWRREFLILFPLYPIYGLAQQLIVQGIFHRRLLLLTGSRPVSVFFTGLMFGVLHVRNPALFALCAFAGLSFAILFQRYRNLWPLGVSHGVLAALTYALVFDKNPLNTL